MTLEEDLDWLERRHRHNRTNLSARESHAILSATSDARALRELVALLDDCHWPGCTRKATCYLNGKEGAMYSLDCDEHRPDGATDVAAAAVVRRIGA